MQGLIGPREEPIDDCAVYERRELSGSSSHIPFGGETKGHVQILLDRVHEPTPAIFSRIGFALTFYFTTNVIDHGLFFVEGIKVGDFSGRQQIVDVNEESFVCNLSFGEEEKYLFFLGTAFEEHILKISFEVVHTVRGGNRDLENGHTHHKGRQFTQRLFAGTSDSNEQGVSRRWEDDSTNSANVFQGIFEEHKTHKGVIIIILLETFLDNR